MKSIIKSFSELTTKELFQIYQLRCAVFIVEQECPYQDVDELDLTSTHVAYYDQDRIVAYGRIYKEQGIVHFGRLIVHKDYRGRALGKRLIQQLLATIEEKFPQKPVEIQAQAYLQDLYSSFGFEPISEVYLEDDIPHIDMHLKQEDLV